MSTHDAPLVCLAMGAVLLALGLTLLGLEWFYGGFLFGLLVGLFIGHEDRR